MSGKTGSQYVKRCALGVSAGLAALTALCMVLALLTVKGVVPEGARNASIYLSVFLASLVTVFVSTHHIKQCAAMSFASATVLVLTLPLIGLCVCNACNVRRVLIEAAFAMLAAAVPLVWRGKGRRVRGKSIGEHKAKNRARR